MTHASTLSSLLSPVSIGDLDLPNRIVMGPMTRSRAQADGTPTETMARYYSQRSTAGLIVSEGAQISAQGRGYPGTPGLYAPEHLSGWRMVTDAVHHEGSRIFAQLWHVGRVSHSSLQPLGALPVAPSAIPNTGQLYTANGPVDYETPRALETSEMAGIVEQFRKAAALARDAGFDGVEIQAANGYLIDQFLRDGSNHRTDAYGGSIANRSRLLLEVTEAVADEVGAARTAVRISPTHPLNAMSDSDPATLFMSVAQTLSDWGLAYLHVVKSEEPFDWRALRAAFAGPVIIAGGYDAERAQEALTCGEADLVAFGAPFIANPDLVARLERGLPLATPDRKYFYSGGARGYIDYPTIGSSPAV